MKRFEAGGLRLAYDDVGEGFPIVWIHGFPLSAAVFRNQLSIPGFRHVVPDLPGFGRSDPISRPFTMDEYASTILALADHLGLERFVAAGLSMGGYVLLALHRAAAARLAALVFIDTRATADSAEGRRGRMDSIAEVKRDGTAALIERMIPQLVATEDEAIRDEVRAILRSASPGGVIAALGAMAERPDSTPQLHAVSQPALVIVGEHDAITPPEVAASMVSAIPNGALVTIEGAGHLTPLEAPAAFNRAVSEWIGRQF